MDLVAGCKDKLTYFRIKELKDILTQLGLSKQGKKQDLIDRISRTFSDEEDSKMRVKKHTIRKEEVAKLIDDTYRKMQVSGATDLASKGQGVSDGSNVKIKGETEDRFEPDTKVRCVCGNPLESGPMIKCSDQRCNVRQHMECVLIPEKPTDGDPPVPDLFYCEICRLKRADPFWLALTHPLIPVKLTATSIPTDGTNPILSVEKTFQLTRADKDLLAKQEYDVQAWCMLLNDKVSYRIQWPQYADLQINGLPVRAINRPGSQLLGANGRDDGPIITACTKDGFNKICLTGCDARIFCLGVRIVKRRTVPQILKLIPKESDGERFEDALARVCRCIGGGPATDNADSDSDIEVVADTFVVNLRCPMSGSRMKVAGRFKACPHMGCFDLDVFVELNQRSRKWQCPICLKNYSLEDIIIDPYFNRIVSLMRHCGEDVTEIEAKPDGSWRAKAKSERERRDLGDLALWHSDGILCAPPVELDVKPKLDALKQIKQEALPEGYSPGLKLGIRKNRNGFWEFSKPNDMNISLGNKLLAKFENNDQRAIPMSSSGSGSRDGEDPSVNQDGGGNFNISGNNGIELESVNLDSAYGFDDLLPSGHNENAEVIVLSDSEEENMLLSSGTAYNNNGSEAGVSFPLPHAAMDPYPGQTLGNDSCLGLFNNNEDEYENLWSLPSGTPAGPPFQLFSSETDVSDALVDSWHGSVNCHPPMNGYSLAPDVALESATAVPDASVGCSDAGINDGLVDNHLSFEGDDPSLQIFLPTRPLHASMQSDSRNQAQVSNGLRADDWISLRLGGGASTSGGHGESTAVNGLTRRQQMPPKEESLLGMDGSRSEKSSRQRSGSPFSFPRQKRSVRPRLYLSIDSDSE